MGNNAAASMSPATRDRGKPIVKSIGFGVLPVDIASIVAEYLSDNSSEYVKTALVGVQPIKLCLSQDCHESPYDLYSSLGLVSHEHKWKIMDFRIDKQFLIKDQKACLDFLEQTNSNDCPVVIEFLAVRLVMHNYFCQNALDDLRNTIVALQSHLKSVKHIVISVMHRACLIFSLKEVIDTNTGVPQSVDQSKALFDIIDDLQTCYKKNYLTVEHLFAFYFKSNVPRKSEKYLTKFVIWLDWLYNREMFNKEAAHIVSNKIKWILYVHDDAFYAKNPVFSRSCNAFHWNGSCMYYWHGDVLCTEKYSKYAFSFRDNPLVERIVMQSGKTGQVLQLPRPSLPLRDNSPRSPLIEITLTGDSYTIHLTELNNGYFPQLRHLCVTRGKITGHLDSRCVPLLKTLILEPGIKTDVWPSDERYSLIRDRVHSLLHCDRPWQVVTTHTNGGWSFASYDEPTTNPQDEVKEDSLTSGSSLHSLPLIRELLLMGSTQKHFDEWQSQLKGFPSLEAAAKDHKDRIVMWEPQCVEKITLCYPVSGKSPRLEFTETILEQERILTSLESHNVSVDVDGDVLPKLQSLELSKVSVKVSGAFPLLQRLSFQYCTLLSPWQVDAPLLQSLDCYRLKDGQNLSMNPNWLPKLSSLQIFLFGGDPKYCPVISDMSGLGFSRLTRVEFGGNMALTPFFDECRVQYVPHLELTLNALRLPACWHKMAWLCETLTIHLYVPTSEDAKSQEPPVEVKTPCLARVKKLTVTEWNCRLLLDWWMAHLTDLTVASPRMFEPVRYCPALKRICFTDKLSESDKKLALDRATYEAIDAQPKEIIFAADYKLHTMAWDVAPNEKQKED